MLMSLAPQVLLHYLKRIALLNPLLKAVTEVASFQQLRVGTVQTCQEVHVLWESKSGSVAAARGDSSLRLGSADRSGERKAGCCAESGSDRSSSDQRGGSSSTAPAKIANGRGNSVFHPDSSEIHSPYHNPPPGEAPQLQGTHTLEGVPFHVKDVIDVAGFRTVAGCELLFRTPPADVSADIVRQLQALGAVPIGKSAVPEACSQSRVDVQTFSRLHGNTENPYRFSVTSGGSSGGSAVAVAVGMVPLAVGTDWAGSLRIPVRGVSQKCATLTLLKAT